MAASSGTLRLQSGASPAQSIPRTSLRRAGSVTSSMLPSAVPRRFIAHCYSRRSLPHAYTIHRATGRPTGLLTTCGSDALAPRLQGRRSDTGSSAGADASDRGRDGCVRIPVLVSPELSHGTHTGHGPETTGDGGQCVNNIECADPQRTENEESALHRSIATLVLGSATPNHPVQLETVCGAAELRFSREFLA